MSEDEKKMPIGVEQLRKAREILRRYQAGKKNLEAKIIKNEKWWKLRHWEEMVTEETKDEPKPASAWLFNVIISKHADYMDSFPESAILPREAGDVEEAKRLSSIIPVVMDQNDYRDVYSDVVWYKLKQGTGVYGVFWDPSKLGGLGDITIKDYDLLNLFWEPGVKDIQKSRNFFSVELVDNSLIEQQYPQAVGHLGSGADATVKKYQYDDAVDTSDKSAVIDWYYHKTVGGKRTLQYVKFVGDVVLYATENDIQRPTEPQEQTVMGEDGVPQSVVVEAPTGESMAERGLYDHGMYPFVFDPLFPEAGMPIGFGFVDVCKNPQASIDIFNNAFEKNIQFVAAPRWMVRNEGGINEEEFANPHNLIVHTDGNLGQDSYAPINPPTFVNSNYIAIVQDKINEMKETAGNRDANNGGTQSGVTAASAIAAMQESAGKTSRDQISGSYGAHKKVVNLVIELIRQFYTMPRQFRITGEDGRDEYVTYDNADIQPQHLGEDFGEDLGYRLPVFDIKVEAEKSSSYSRLSQNEMALQFYNSGFFNPQMADQAVACIEMMEFQGKSQVLDKIKANGGMYQQMLMLQQQMLQQAEIIDSLTGGQTAMADQMAAQINGNLDVQGPRGSAKLPAGSRENAVVENARERAAEASKPR
ncbi:portal protein [Lachnoclostridium sp. Marseille-P6806]|uniref:portal protein n=1 Tax=Lachnoclostridium sp. Marseille-P6806 TaxID=2364793 RepID=UPI00102FC00E|nr:hypothetical protein [Lachnoclostridium sp. Marseille-P6806]